MYKQKYLKYKQKYLDLYNVIYGGVDLNSSIEEITTFLKDANKRQILSIFHPDKCYSDIKKECDLIFKHISNMFDKETDLKQIEKLALKLVELIKINKQNMISEFLDKTESVQELRGIYSDVLENNEQIQQQGITIKKIY